MAGKNDPVVQDDELEVPNDNTTEQEPEEPIVPSEPSVAESAAEIPIWGYELEDYINVGTPSAPKWHEATNLLSWELEDDAETYDPSYIDTKTKKSFTVGKSATISYEKDAYRNNAFDEWLMEHEDDANIPVEVVRVRTWTKNAEGVMTAKKAAYSLTPKQLDKNKGGEPIKLKGELSMTDSEWTQGTWNGIAFTKKTE